MKNKIVIILLAFTTSFGNLVAQKPAVMLNDKTGWHKIATKNVDFKKDRDDIPVNGADRFAKIKVIVASGAFDLYDLEVYFDGGAQQVINVRNPIKTGGESQVYDLKGSERDLKKIILVYKSLPNFRDKKSVVEIWGYKSNANPNKTVIPSPAVVLSDKTGWHKIGERNIDFKTDRDEIIVMGADRFSAIKFLVSEAAIDLQDLEVYYESGDKQEIPVRTPLMIGSESRVIDLNGGERRLKKIVFIYKTLPNNDKERSHIEIYGLKTNSN